MYLELRGFRSHNLSTWSFELGGSNYITGDNGSGKSDIYRAITWAIYGENEDNVYQAGNKAQVVVKLQYRNCTIRRQANSRSLYVTIDGIKSKGLEAQANLVRYFGTPEKWHLASYITQDSAAHAFIMARPEERMNVINRLIGNDEGAKTRIDTLLRDAKADANIFKRLYEKSAELFETKYSSYDTSIIHKQTPEELSSLEAAIELNSSLLVKIRLELNKKHMVTRESSNILSRLAELSSYTSTELVDLKFQRKVYIQAQKALEAFEAHDAKFGSPPAEYTYSEYNSSVVQSDIYARNRVVANSCNVPYNSASILTQIADLSSSILYFDRVVEAGIYKHQFQKVAKLRDQIHRRNLKLGNLDPVEFIQSQERNLEYIGAFENRRHRNNLELQIHQLPHKLSKAQIHCLTESIENQWILDAYDTYNKLKAQLPELNSTSLDGWRQELQDAKNSLHILECPNCQTPVQYNNNQLVKYDGRVLKNLNTSEIESRIAIAEQLEHSKLPELPDGLVRINVPAARNIINVSTRYGILHNQLQELEIVHIPDGVLEISNVRLTQELCKIAKELIKLSAELSRELGILDNLPNPPIPENVSNVADLETAQILLNTLRSIQVVPKPVDSSSILDSIEWHKLKSAVPLDIQKISESKVDMYIRNLTEKHLLETRIVELASVLQKFTATEDIFEATRIHIQELQARHKAGINYRKVTLAARDLKAEKAQRDLKITYVGAVKEYSEIYRKATKLTVNSTVYAIQHGVNGIMKKLLQQDITIQLAEHNNKLKFEFCKNSINHGDPKQMSGGERSILTFACMLVFNKLTNSKILMLDEATEGLTPNRKDDCIQFCIDYMQKSNKTLIITDHSCHTGDYTKIINILK